MPSSSGSSSPKRQTIEMYDHEHKVTTVLQGNGKNVPKTQCKIPESCNRRRHGCEKPPILPFSITVFEKKVLSGTQQNGQSPLELLSLYSINLFSIPPLCHKFKNFYHISEIATWSYRIVMQLLTWCKVLLHAVNPDSVGTESKAYKTCPPEQ